MPTRLPERHATPADQSDSIVFPLTLLVMLPIAAFLSAIALSWMEQSFGSDDNVVRVILI
jgi:hypothetical protein